MKRQWAFNDSPEGRLILAISSIAPGDNELSDLLREKLTWPDILETALACDLAPLLYHRLKNLSAACLVPPAAMNRLKKIYQWHAARNVNLYGKLQEVRHAFAQDNIQLVLLKGAVLADLIYGNVALRPMRDLDLLVRKCDLDSAVHLLRKLGYTPSESYRPEAWFRSFHHNIPYLSPDRSLILELHFHIVPPAAPVSIAPDDLWQDARTVAVMNEPAMMLSPEHFLLHLCVHLAYDDRFYRSLRALTDITATLAFYREALDWGKLLAYAHAWKADRSMYYALWLAHTLVGAEVPGAVLNGFAENKGNSLVNDFVTKQLIRRSVSIYDNQDTAVPGWVMKKVCGQLLLSSNVRQCIAGLSRRFPPRYVFNKVFETFRQLR